VQSRRGAVLSLVALILLLALFIVSGVYLTVGALDAGIPPPQLPSGTASVYLQREGVLLCLVIVCLVLTTRAMAAARVHAVSTQAWRTAWVILAAMILQVLSIMNATAAVCEDSPPCGVDPAAQDVWNHLVAYSSAALVLSLATLVGSVWALRHRQAPAQNQ
jgi:hypothetical protein